MSEFPGEYMTIATEVDPAIMERYIVRCPRCKQAKGWLVTVGREKWIEVYGPDDDPMTIPWIPFAKCKCGEIIRFGQRKDVTPKLLPGWDGKKFADEE